MRPPLLLAAVMLAITTSSVFAQSPTVAWAKASNGVFTANSNWSDNAAMGTARDAAGNVYTTGRFLGRMDFDPGPGFDTADTYIPPPDNSMYLVKYDSLGNFIWRRSVHKTMSNAIAIDDSGYIYTAGQLKGTATFGSGTTATTLTSIDSGLTGGDIFIAKWNGRGEFIWARRAGGTNPDMPMCLAVDHNGNVYMGGNYFSSQPVEFNATQPGSVTLPATQIQDGFLAKYSSAGTALWARAVTGSGGEQVNRIAVSPVNGMVVVSGYTTGGCTFPPNVTAYASHGQTDGFVAAYSSAGSFIRAKLLGGTDQDFAEGIIVDKSGDVIVTGYTYGTFQFDPAIPASATTLSGTTAGFIVKMNDTLGYKWSRCYTGPGYTTMNGIGVDDSANIYAAGNYQTSINLNPSVPGIAAAYTSNAVYEDMYLIKLRADGSYGWSMATACSKYVEPYGVFVDHQANIYVAGVYADTCSFYPGLAGASVRTSYWQAGMSGQNSYTVKYSQPKKVIAGVTPVASTLSGLSIYPNPASNQVTIEGMSTGDRASIYSITGQQVMSLAVHSSKQVFDVSLLPTGTYFLIMNNSSGTTGSVKITKD